jgi:hypothetical protein
VLGAAQRLAGGLAAGSAQRRVHVPIVRPLMLNRDERQRANWNQSPNSAP